MPSDTEPRHESEPGERRDDGAELGNADMISLTDFFDAIDRAAFQRTLAHRDNEEPGYDPG